MPELVDDLLDFVIKNKDIRIQAKKIYYIHRSSETYKEHYIEAQDNLMIQYKGKIFVGEKLKYDFSTQTGTIIKY